MTHNHLGKALRYKLRSSLPGIAIFYAISIAVLFGILIGILQLIVKIDGMENSISGFGMAAAIMVFVVGIVTIREDLRLFIQHGIGRRTIFIMESLAILIVSMILALGERLLMMAGALITQHNPNVNVYDLYQNLFMADSVGKSPLITQIESLLAFFAVIAFTYFTGMLISLVFYRLNKLWTVIVAVGAPLFLFVGLPVLISYTDLSFDAPTNFILSSPWIFTGCTLAAAAALAFLNWLLLRRAPIKTIAK